MIVSVSGLYVQPARKRDPARTIAAQAADGDYYFSLPNGFCVLNKTKAADARIFDEVLNQATAEAEAQKGAIPPRGAAGGDGQKPGRAEQPAISGLFASCDELQDYRATDNRLKLTRLGAATGLRRRQQDPSANAGIVYFSRMMCGMLRAGGSDGLREQTEQQRSERIAEGLEAGHKWNAGTAWRYQRSASRMHLCWARA